MSTSPSHIEIQHCVRSKLVAPLKILPRDDTNSVDSLSKPHLRVDELLGARSDESFVCSAIGVLFQRPASSACIEHHVNFLRSANRTRSQVLKVLVESPEGVQNNAQLIGLAARVHQDLAAIQSSSVTMRVLGAIKNFWKTIWLAISLRRVLREHSVMQEEKALQNQNRLNNAIQELQDQLMQAESRIADLEKYSERCSCSNVSRSASNAIGSLS